MAATATIAPSRAAMPCQVLPAENILEVRYEEIVGDMEAQARRLIAYCLHIAPGFFIVLLYHSATSEHDSPASERSITLAQFFAWLSSSGAQLLKRTCGLRTTDNNFMKKRIPTNLVTGFLGTGKTTAVLDLLKKKPAQEKWAVLVNEFGEVGIDGEILRGSGAEIREVAGGCMCCVADLPMKVALNALIARAKPDRLLIETTGLGHPQALIDTLSDQPYGELLELDAVICLVDPRKLREQRYLEHKIFRDQLHIADVVVANKTDLCDADDKLAFTAFVAALQPPKQAQGWSSQGQLQLQWLSLRHGGQRTAPRNTPQKNNLLRMPLPPLPPLSLAAGELFTRRENSGDGYFSCGWLFAEQVRFEYSAITDLLNNLNVTRYKGLIKTDRGNYVFNDQDGVLNIEPVGKLADSIIELIHHEATEWQRIEQSLLDAFYRQHP